MNNKTHLFRLAVLLLCCCCIPAGCVGTNPRISPGYSYGVKAEIKEIIKDADIYHVYVYFAGKPSALLFVPRGGKFTIRPEDDNWKLVEDTRAMDAAVSSIKIEYGIQDEVQVISAVDDQERRVSAALIFTPGSAELTVDENDPLVLEIGEVDPDVSTGGGNDSGGAGGG